ncbi:hypothetical protein Pres01_22810 [Metapseudomonas resinovorans]|uniref:hypothetical protein n=1 Tax=Metapseudomonas resinovorans TaxID=53412 RepID=UPI000985C2E7|nr:hypothetical protein [Pseudomonas resinovorans]GLZ86230.1 hypothetical protein Pres01_22810 [Pseudomonas resinovorans]
MKAWLGVAVACSTGVAALACATVLLTPAPEPVSASRPMPPPTIASARPLPVAAPAPALPAEGRGRPLAVAVPEREAPRLDQAEAIQLIQLMAEKGDPRSPTLGGLKPRQGATLTELADPRQYAALEERQTRELLQAYAGGVQQIPEIRARIEAAEQSGERSASELDEARAALEQLESMKGRLESEAPQLLPDAGSQAPAKDG